MDERAGAVALAVRADGGASGRETDCDEDDVYFVAGVLDGAVARRGEWKNLNLR